jgi:DUF1680 family protein
MLFQKQGNTNTAETVETIFYNAAQGARNPNHSCIAYLKTDNSYEMEGTKNGEIEPNRKQIRYKYSPAHQEVAVCCNPNAGRITPYFLENSWLLENKNTFVNALLGPTKLESNLNNNPIAIEVVTEYPYQNKFTYKITNPSLSSFKIKIRKPSWATKIVTSEKYKIEDGFLLFDRKFMKADSIQIEFKAEVSIKQDANREKYFTYGALFYAKAIDAEEQKGKSYFEGFDDYLYKPKNNFRYQLIENNEAVYENNQIKLSAKNAITNQIEEITLVPFGKTILRQVSFGMEK